MECRYLAIIMHYVNCYVISAHFILFACMFINHNDCIYSYRLRLAALHLNENSNRKHAKTKAGEYRYQVVFSKYKNVDTL